MLRFKVLELCPDTGRPMESVCVVHDGHTVTRILGYNRMDGGFQYEFACSCGWHTRAGSLAKWSNREAERHAEIVKRDAAGGHVPDHLRREYLAGNEPR